MLPLSDEIAFPGSCHTTQAVPPVPRLADRAHGAGRLTIFGNLTGLAERRVFMQHSIAGPQQALVGLCQPPFAGPEAVLAQPTLPQVSLMLGFKGNFIEDCGKVDA
jgi:hypothetical protein